jgi:hypothetical protein
MAIQFSWGGFVNEASHAGTGEAIQDAKKTTFKALKGVGAQKVVIRIVGCCG